MADHLADKRYYFTHKYRSAILIGTKTCKISRLSVKKINFVLSTYLRGDNSIDMVHPPLDIGGSTRQYRIKCLFVI